MIIKPAQFSAEDAKVIQEVSINPLKSATWSDDRLANMKSRAKKHYIKVQKNCCCYCGERLLTEHGRVWDLEHVVPKDSHPDFMFEPVNLAVACPDCNQAKSNNQTLIDPTVVTYPTTSESYLVVHPHFDRWKDHLDKCGLVFKPLSDKGTWTAKHCNLGRYFLKYIDPTDVSNPFDQRFENSVDALTSDPATAQAALERLQSYLAKVTNEVPT